jgi:hypothetical protein
LTYNGPSAIIKFNIQSRHRPYQPNYYSLISAGFQPFFSKGPA